MTVHAGGQSGWEPQLIRPTRGDQRDGRRHLVVTVDTVDTVGAASVSAELGVIRSTCLESGECWEMDDPGAWWRLIRRRCPERRSLVVTDRVDRLLALVGPPPESAEVLEWTTEAGLHTVRLRSSWWRSDLWQAHNLGYGVLPDGDHDQLVRSVRAYTGWCRRHRLGRLRPTLAAQMRASFLARWYSPLWSHNCLPAWDLEMAAKATPPIMAIHRPGTYSMLWECDIVACYLSVMARQRLPVRLEAFIDGDPGPGLLRDVRLGRLKRSVIAEVTTDDGERRVVTTPELADFEVARVHRVAVYAQAPVLRAWARYWWRAREASTGLEQRVTKAACQALHMRLGMAGRAWMPATDTQAVLHSGGTTVIDGTRVEHRDGQLMQRRGDLWRRGANAALGAEVVGWGRHLLRSLDAGGVVAEHTDGLWCLRPPTNHRLGSGLGDMRQVQHTDVTITDTGARYIGGALDAHPGIPAAVLDGEPLRMWRPWRECPPNTAVADLRHYPAMP